MIHPSGCICDTKYCETCDPDPIWNYIPFNGEPVPDPELNALEPFNAYCWLLASGVPVDEALRRVWGDEPPVDVCQATFRAIRRIRASMIIDYEFHGRQEWQPSPEAMELVSAL